MTVYRPRILGKEGKYKDWYMAFASREKAEDAMSEYSNLEHEILIEKVSVDHKLLAEKPLLDLLTEEQKALHSYQTMVKNAGYGIFPERLEREKEAYLEARREIKTYFAKLLLPSAE